MDTQGIGDTQTLKRAIGFICGLAIKVSNLTLHNAALRIQDKVLEPLAQCAHAMQVSNTDKFNHIKMIVRDGANTEEHGYRLGRCDEYFDYEISASTNQMKFIKRIFPERLATFSLIYDTDTMIIFSRSAFMLPLPGSEITPFTNPPYFINQFEGKFLDYVELLYQDIFGSIDTTSSYANHESLVDMFEAAMVKWNQGIEIKDFIDIQDIMSCTFARIDTDEQYQEAMDSFVKEFKEKNKKKYVDPGELEEYHDVAMAKCMAYYDEKSQAINDENDERVKLALSIEKHFNRMKEANDTIHGLATREERATIGTFFSIYRRHLRECYELGARGQLNQLLPLIRAQNLEIIEFLENFLKDF